MYGNLLSESPFYTTSEKDGFRKVSSDWHRFLHFEFAWDEGGANAETRAEREEKYVEEEF